LNKKGWLQDLIETVVVVTVLFIILRSFVEPRWIPSASMRPTLLEGDRIFIEKVTQKFNLREVKRGDILVFYPPFAKLPQDLWSKFTRLIGLFDKNDAYIKRVIAIEGDKYTIGTDKKTGRNVVYINGKLLKEPYLYDNDNIDCQMGMNCGPAVVPKGYLLMLGDNRANSQDGRFWGLLPKERVIGKAVFIFWPINRIKIFINPEY